MRATIVTMADSPSPSRRALRLIVLINIPALILLGLMAWVSHHKAQQAAASRAAYLPMDKRVQDLIESERDIDKLRSIARIQNLGASGSTEALLHVSQKSATALLPGMVLPLVSVLVAGAALRAPSRKRTRVE